MHTSAWIVKMTTMTLAPNVGRALSHKIEKGKHLERYLKHFIRLIKLRGFEGDGCTGRLEDPVNDECERIMFEREARHH